LFVSQVSEAVVRSGLRADVGGFSGLVILVNREELVVAQFLKYAMLLVGAFVVMSVPAMAQEGSPAAAVSETVPLLNLTATFVLVLLLSEPVWAFPGCQQQHSRAWLASPKLLQTSKAAWLSSRR